MRVSLCVPMYRYLFACVRPFVSVRVCGCSLACGTGDTVQTLNGLQMELDKANLFDVSTMKKLQDKNSAAAADLHGRFQKEKEDLVKAQNRLREQIGKEAAEQREQEEALRKKRKVAEKDISDVAAEAEREMKQLEDEAVAIRKSLESEEAQLAKLEAYFDQDDAEQARMREEQKIDDARQALKAKERAYMDCAACLMQSYWRGIKQREVYTKQKKALSKKKKASPKGKGKPKKAPQAAS
eukprot:GHVU01004333.1.p1 GENE.GHVU01004333.1~~GHVU01004333.1.p1  ORF type:complete len:240 (+),score=58.47 GHVU01004333.1:2755-3474(+)